MMKLITFILSLCVFSLCQAQDWTPIDIGTQEDLNEVYFMDDANGIIIGDNGTLFKTTDGGSSWVNIPTGALHDLVTVSFVDQNVGFINGLKTTNGGDSWTVQSATEIFSLIKGLDAENLIGGNGFIFDGAIYKSTDGGVTWQVISDPIETGFYTDEYFVDDNIGYMTSWYSGHLIKTEDGGENWTELTSINQTTDFSDYRGVTFPSLNIGIVASNAHIVKTMDGGASWSSIYSISDNNLLFNTRGVFSTSENNYIVVGGSLSNSVETIYETTDGGLTWTLTNDAVHTLESVACTSNNCYAVGQNGTVLTKGNNTVAINDPLQASEEIFLYPNPTLNYLQINSGEEDVEWVEIIDVSGKVHEKYCFPENAIFVGDLPKGIYLLKIKLEQRESILKFEKI